MENMSSFCLKVGSIIPNANIFPEKGPVYSPFIRLGIHRQWFCEFEEKLGKEKKNFLLKSRVSLDQSLFLSGSPSPPFSLLVSLQSVELTVDDIHLEDASGIVLYCDPRVKYLLPEEGELCGIRCDGLTTYAEDIRDDGGGDDDDDELAVIQLQPCTLKTREFMERMIHEHPQDLAWLESSMRYLMQRYPILCTSLIVPCDVMAASTNAFIPVMKVTEIESTKTITIMHSEKEDTDDDDHEDDDRRDGLDVFLPYANGNMNLMIIIDDDQKWKGSKVVQIFHEHLLRSGFNDETNVPHVLVMGPSGSGKSHILHQWCALNFPIDAVSFLHCPSLICGGVSETIRAVREKWEGMTCIVLDDIDLVFSQRSEFDTIHRVLLSEILRILDEGVVHVFASASDASSLVSDLRQKGRFSPQWDFFMPIDACVEDVKRTIGFQDFDAMDGFLPCDVVRWKQDLADEDISEDDGGGSAKEKRKTKRKMKKVKEATALQKYQTKASSDIRFSDLFGMDEAIELVNLCVIHPFTRRRVYDEWGIHPPKGILIHGPTGVGKTALCQSIVNEIHGVHCVIVAVGELMSKVVGDSEKKIAQIFRDARQSAPSILIFDSIDVLGSKRVGQWKGDGDSDIGHGTASDRLLSSLLIEMDGLRGKHDSVTIVATTKDPKKLDEALLRPGRFDRHIALRTPQTMEETWNVFQLFLARIPHQLLETVDDSTRMKMKMRINGMSPCDIENIIRESVMQQLRVDIHSQQLDLHFIAKRLGCVL